MKSIGDPAALAALISRLQRLTPARERVWGSITAHQMVSHVGDASEAALARRPFSPTTRSPSRLLKFVALSLPMKWPRGVKSGADPAAKVLPVEQFPADVDRAVRTLQDLAAAPPTGVADRHPIFGAMSAVDWRRWAFLHTDHHLRQFGL
jgi:hypothetical protein